MQVLNDVSLQIKAGEQVALVGASGAGKSTLVALILRLYHPNSGSLKLDGTAYDQWNLHVLRKNMALVPQEVLLFGGSIAENIAYGKPGASQDEIVAAAKEANAHEFISQFPDRYETFVGERGVQLSGGQKQRVAIARAILKNPAILLLDEATSALDTESENLVQEALERLLQDRTSIVIAHRLSTLRSADRIVVLEHGKIVEMGTPGELAAREDSKYRQMLQLQNLGST
jgi:ABC-type multidrug transport system fused ATPase/permease subunit